LTGPETSKVLLYFRNNFEMGTEEEKKKSF
jgi:hypothetical protein